MAKWKNRKRQQRKINKLIKAINNNIANDNLWRGRFATKQISSRYYSYFDGSGGELWVRIELKDRKTNFTSQVWIRNNIFVESEMFRLMNNFIVEDCNVWANPKEIYEDKTDWRKYE